MRAVRINKIDRGTKEVVGFRWRFEEYSPDRKRYEPVPVAQIPSHIRLCQDEQEVQAYVKSQNAIVDAIKHRAEKLREWKERYHDFREYLERFAEFQKERAPNSWENDVFYLENYAFGFFLSKSNLNNINHWPQLFDDFRQWLKEQRPLKHRKSNLALNTQVKIIKALNRFLAFCHSKGWISQLPKCTSYQREETITVSADDLTKPEEIPLIREALREIRPISEEFFMVLHGTGLRINEGLGLCLDFVTEGKIDGPKSVVIHEKLQGYSLGEYHGYICLESQPALSSIRASEHWTDRHGVSWRAGSVPKRPLKHRKKIDAKFYRYIPVFSADVWNILAKRTNAANELFEQGKLGTDGRDYLLFDGLTASMFYSDLAKAYEALKLRQRSPHKLRHTFLTWFYEKVGEDMFLAEKVAGHRDKRDVERYNHLGELIGRERKLQARRGERLKLVVAET